ncbi:MAG: methionine--tRNA ligase [bacterium]|nr:methionine--tRNA ligase [bacterium]
MSEKILVTSALPYANGSIHLGHLVEYIQTDIWVRFLRMRGKDIIYICADDAHGTPIEIRAANEGITPEELIGRYQEEHEADFADFDIQFDFFGSTHCDENRKWSETFYKSLQDGGHIVSKEIEQTYCDHCKRFLPDRYVRGTCPKCGAEDQYGDQCEVCNSTYSPTDLKEPKCSVCGNPAVRKKSVHDCVKLGDFADFLNEWVETQGHVSDSVRKFLRQWLKEGLKDWDIMRDAPYFGFPVPGHEDKYFYVWLDAPIGYISNAERWCKVNGKDIEKDYWRNPDTKIYHFIGKDIIYFHTLFWPAMLKAAGLNVPDAVYVHGFLTVDGTKMSKSRGTFIMGRTFLDHLDPQYLRYFYASKLNSGIDDIDLNFTDFENRVNAELVNKIANLASRSISFVSKRFDCQLGKLDEAGAALVKKAQEAGEGIAAFFEARNYSSAIEQICRIADSANVYFQESAPWALIKDDPEAAQSVCTAGINISRILAIYLQPVVPEYAANIRAMLDEGEGSYQWSDADSILKERKINRFTRLVEKVEQKKVKKMVEASVVKEEKPAKKKEKEIPKLAETIDIDKFVAVDMRAARIIEAEIVTESKKLLKLKLDVGPLGQRTVFAGIRKSFPEPEKLINKKVAMVANLAPRKMKFGVSEGMVMATGADDNSLSLLELNADVPEGSRVT